ncbi:MAG: glycosyltransferase [Pseudomonadota bacterium]
MALQTTTRRVLRVQPDPLPPDAQVLGTVLRLVAPPRPAPPPEALAVRLLRDGVVGPDDIVRALSRQADGRGGLKDLLQAPALVSEAGLLRATAAELGVPVLNPLQTPPDSRLVERLGAAFCLRAHLLPWRRIGRATVILSARPADFDRNRPQLEAALGVVTMALAPVGQIQRALMDQHGKTLADAAETRVPGAESCRVLTSPLTHHRASLAAITLILALWLAPVAVGLAATFLALISLILLNALKLAATFAALRASPVPDPPVDTDALPVISVIVAMYDEGDIAPRLIRRLSRLDYPRDRLDIVLAVEAADTATRAALAAADLPGWMRVIVVPEGRITTKPRALNVALEHCRGSIVGVYDAEDAPAPDQLRKVAARFAARGAEVACLQGKLDFYNPTTNWLSRCFTVEYAIWFRLVLPGLARLGLVIPLGGTTLFFRRTALEQLGGWDAHNVTEDADLGLRLARHGLTTDILDTVTEEEANCRTLPWIKQRSRWIKGYMMTWAVHHRDPRLLWRQLGTWRFFGVQLLFLGTLVQVLLAPLLWSFWLVPLGLPHPVADALPGALWDGMFLIFMVSEVLGIVLGIVALGQTRHRLSRLWVPTLHLYFPLAAIASYKAAWETVMRPFFWDKTRHGLHDAGL